MPCAQPEGHVSREARGPRAGPLGVRRRAHQIHRRIHPREVGGDRPGLTETWQTARCEQARRARVDEAARSRARAERSQPSSEHLWLPL